MSAHRLAAGGPPHRERIQVGQTRQHRFLAAAALIALALSACRAADAQQDIAAKVATMRNGEVRLALPSRPDVCGDGDQMISVRGSMFIGNMNSVSHHRWQERCTRGPLRVRLTMRDGVVDRVQVAVSGSWDSRTDSVLDLGVVPAAVGGRYLVSLGETLSGRAAGRAITAAALVDSVTLWPDFLRIARAAKSSKAARSESLFWLSALAGDRVTGDSTSLEGEEDDEKTHALFVLHELRNKQGVPELLRIARTHKEPHVRRRALFWLGQDGDSRAIDLFEEILKGSRPL